MASKNSSESTQKSKKEQLSQLYAKLEKEASDLPLASKAEDIVPGEGNPDAQVFFIGEAPGYHESVQRRPFVGRSGQLLRKTLEEIKLPPPEVYIGNIVKVRPPDNRDPSPKEIKAYKSYLDQEIEVIDPMLIATLGRFSMAKFLPDVKISQVHGRLHKVTWNDKIRFILPLYHPAAALRNSNVKNQFVKDVEKIPKILDWIKNQKDTYTLQKSVKDVLM